MLARVGHLFRWPRGLTIDWTHLRTSMSSIKGKIFIIFAVTALSILMLTVLNLWSLAAVQSRLIIGERYDDLLNNILEVRRFEKNYLFYNDPGSLAEGINYLSEIDKLAKDLAPDMTLVLGERTLYSFTTTLKEYDRTMRALRDGRTPDRERIRTLGKALVDMADNLRTTKRERIHRTIQRTSLLPFAFTAVFLLLVVFVIKIVSYGLLKPLGVVRTTTERVARGDFSPIPYEHGQISEIEGLFGAFNRMAQELETNQENLLQARKIAALGTFTAGIAHELNNPINNISLTAETLIDAHAEALDSDATELVQDIIAQADRASDIVKNLLDFSRTERPTFSRLMPHDIVRSTVSLVRNQVMLSGLKLKVDVPADLPAVQGDLRGLQQVFMNLLLNAIQATPTGGLITLTASDDSPGYVRIEVRDTGSGIKPEALQHIFEPFFTTKEVGRGTGLGLAVAYSIVKRHGGRIEVTSEMGQGSVFSVTLPISKPAVDADGHAMEHEHADETSDY